jgi:uncharacterized protein YggE
MKKLILIAAVLAFSLVALPSILAQNQTGAEPQAVQNHVITVTRGSNAYTKPDLGIMVMSIQSASPIAEEAVAENGRKAKAVESALAALGYTPENFKITSATIGHGGPNYGPMQPGMVAYKATQLVYVFFEAADLSDMAKLTEKTAAVIEALRKAGAVPGNAEGPRMPQMQGGLIIYTIKDSEPYEKQALRQAIARARDAAQDMATGLGVQIAGLRNVKASGPSSNLQNGNVPLEGLHYRFYSLKSDEIRIHASVTVDYDFK